jgi:hypothetical protein
MKLQHGIAIGAALAFLAMPTAALAADASTKELVSPLVEKALIAVVSAFLSLVTGYVLLQAKERREKHKRISYDLEIRQGLIASDEHLPEPVSVSYKGEPAKRLALAICHVRNTGTTVVKGQAIRFDFGSDARVLDAYQEPLAPREYGVSDVTADDNRINERRFKIEHFEKGDQIRLCFVLAGVIVDPVKVVPYNAEGDVEFLPATVSRARDDRARAEQFIRYFALWWILPSVANWIPVHEIATTARGLVELVLVVSMLPLVSPFARAVAARWFGDTSSASRGRTRAESVSSSKKPSAGGSQELQGASAVQQGFAADEAAPRS